nr:uncharacterized mitochondrial protein AtMg00810-like [Tanacetum cinerariifolium]
ESEYVAVSSCCAQVLWMRTQLTDYGFFYDKVPIYCDSKSAIAISCNPVQHTRTKHIDVRVSTTDYITMAETLVYIRKSATKDKSKGKMTESETLQTKTKLQQEQERLGFEATVRLQAELDEEERQRITRLQAEEREKYTEAEQPRMLAELINQRKRYFVAQRAEQKRNKPPRQAQQRTYMSNYIKNTKGYTLKQDEVDRAVPELATGSSNRDAEEELNQGGSKRQKTGKSLELAKEPRDKEADELSQEELQQMMIIVPVQGMNVEALQTNDAVESDGDDDVGLDLLGFYVHGDDDVRTWGMNFLESYGYIDPMVILIQIPYMLHLEGKLFESHRCLLFVFRVDTGSSEFTIYEMMIGCSVWTVRYHVDTDDFMTPFLKVGQFSPLIGALFWEKGNNILFW